MDIEHDSDDDRTFGSPRKKRRIENNDNGTTSRNSQTVFDKPGGCMSILIIIRMFYLDNIRNFIVDIDRLWVIVNTRYTFRRR